MTTPAVRPRPGPRPALDRAPRAGHAAGMLAPGKQAPAFALPDQDGKTVSLGDLAGQWVVLFFYPKDDTPG